MLEAATRMSEAPLASLLLQKKSLLQGRCFFALLFSPFSSSTWQFLLHSLVVTCGNFFFPPLPFSIFFDFLSHLNQRQQKKSTKMVSNLFFSPKKRERFSFGLEEKGWGAVSLKGTSLLPSPRNQTWQAHDKKKSRGKQEQHGTHSAQKERAVYCRKRCKKCMLV